MLYAYDKDGKQHKFHHAIDWKTVIREKGFTPNPPGVHDPILETQAAEGEQIEGIEIEVTDSTNPTLGFTAEPLIGDSKKTIEKIEKDPKIILGEKTNKKITKIVR